MASLPRGGPPREFAGGRYEVLGVLGSGGTATVYRVRDTKLDVDRALKVLRVGNVDLGRRLAAEARMMARLDHPHILRVVDVGEDEDRPYLVMDHLSGGSLADIAEWGPLPLKSALGWTLQTLSALSAAHELGIVHRDVKPSNVLLDDRGVARLADFGIALLADGAEQRETRTGVAMGTLAFMAPEQRLDARSVSRSADLYAVGATLFALLTYRPAMDLFVVQNGDPRLQGVPDALVDVILRATRYQPQERYATAADMARDLLDLFEQAEDEPLPVVSADGEPAQRLRTATPGPLGSRVRPPLEVTERAIVTLVGTGPRARRRSATPPLPVATRNMAGKMLLGTGLLVAIVVGAVVLYPAGPSDEGVGDQQPAPLGAALVVPPPEPEGPAEQPSTAVVEPVPAAVEVASPPPSPRVVQDVVPAPSEAPAPAPRVASGPFPSGSYHGMLDGRPVDLVVSGTAAEVTAWFSEADRSAGTDNHQTRAFRAEWDEAGQQLVLTDTAEFAGAGTIEAAWDGRRFSGRFRSHNGSHVTLFEARPQ